LVWNPNNKKSNWEYSAHSKRGTRDGMGLSIHLTHSAAQYYAAISAISFPFAVVNSQISLHFLDAKEESSIILIR
jgi:hypothetical protein